MVTGSCSAWRSWSRVCSLWCYGWPTLSNCCTSSSVTSLSCCPGGGTRRTKVDCSTSHSDQACSVSKCVFKMWVCVLSGLLDSEMSSTRTACEEAMTVLEEVIMFTFQQSVYYLTKVSCHTLIIHSCSDISAFHILLTRKTWAPFTCEAGNRTV